MLFYLNWQIQLTVTRRTSRHAPYPSVNSKKRIANFIQLRKMTFNKLLIIFALVAFVRPEIMKFGKCSLEGSDTIVWDKRGIEQGYFSIDTDDGVHPWTNSSSSSKLNVLPSSITSESSFATYHIYNYTQLTCKNAFDYYNDSFFDLEAAVILAYYSQNIVPSGLQFLNCYPKYLKTLTDAQPTGTTQTVITGCSNTYSFQTRLN
ncbi:MAG: hypothetical protein EZS28_019142, partial [Streblomastix strix]